MNAKTISEEISKLAEALRDIYVITQSTPEYSRHDGDTIEVLRQEAQRLEDALAKINSICDKNSKLFEE